MHHKYILEANRVKTWIFEPGVLEVRLLHTADEIKSKSTKHLSCGIYMRRFSSDMDSRWLWHICLVLIKLTDYRQQTSTTLISKEAK